MLDRLETHLLVDRLKTLPLEVLMEICANLTNKDIGTLSSVDKALLLITRADSLWKAKFEINFPDVYLKLKNRNPPVPENGWYTAFVDTYEAQYRSLNSNRMSALFSRIKEGKDFTDLGVTYPDLFKKDINGKSIVAWAREKNNQAALDAFFNNKNIRIAMAQNTSRPVAWTFSNETVYISGILGWAVVFRQPEAFLKRWLEGGATYDDPIVYILALDGNLSALKLFIEHAKNTKDIDLIASEPQLLSGAAAKGHVKIVKYLLNRGVNPETAQGHLKPTPLYLAAAYGHVEVAKLLLEAKASVCSADISAAEQGPITFMLPIHVAAQKGHLEIIKLFWEHKKGLIYLTDMENKKPIHFAAEQGHLEIIKFFLEQDKNLLNEKDDSGQTPLLFAASEGHMDTVSYLLDQGAELFNANTSSYENRFFHAAVNGHLEMAKFLVKKYPTLLKNSNPEKILVLAAHRGHVEIVKYLLSEGVQPAKVTGVHFRNCYTDSLTVAEKTIDRPDIDPLTIAVKNGHLEVVKVLLAHSPTNNAINSSLSSAQTKTMVTVLLKHCFSQVASAEMLVDKFKNLEEKHYEIALSHCKLFHNDLITQASLLSLFFQQLPTKQFKAFFMAVVQLDIFSIDDVVAAAENKSTAEKENFQQNKIFITTEVASFTPYRKKIEALIAKLNTKSQALKKEHALRSAGIANLAAILQREVNQFFIQPSHENSKILFDHCKAAVEDSRDRFTNSPQTSFEWRIIAKILLIVAHIFVMTIPFIWLHPASRNLLLDKTDSQAKAEDALESIRQFNQLMSEKKFDHFFHPVKPAISNAETPVNEDKSLLNPTGI